ncbi:MAG: PilZ domain-containing protein [Chloroflexi bacterium]|nr:PilZ domain-containing protein [Chloroflexota bacterium]MCA2001619.1 PilZ domain-containing protein [Chloroflexota bacterium]
MSTQRKEPRKKLMAFTPVYDIRHKTLLGYVVDLTLKGAQVSGERAVEAGSYYILGIEFPEVLPAMDSARIVVPSRAAWCRQDESSQSFNIGFEFNEVSKENAAVIEAILERYQFRSALNDSDL